MFFVRNETTGIWRETQKLTASNGAASDRFGYGVDLKGNILVIGALGKVTNTGGAYVYVNNGTFWNLHQMLNASDGLVQDNFGNAVSFSGDYVVIGAIGVDYPVSQNLQRAVYLFFHKKWRSLGST